MAIDDGLARMNGMHPEEMAARLGHRDMWLIACRCVQRPPIQTAALLDPAQPIRPF